MTAVCFPGSVVYALSLCRCLAIDGWWSAQNGRVLAGADKSGDSPMALTVLTSLVDAYVKSVDAKEAARAMAALDAEFNLVEVVVSSLEVRALFAVRMFSDRHATHSMSCS